MSFLLLKESENPEMDVELENKILEAVNMLFEDADLDEDEDDLDEDSELDDDADEVFGELEEAAGLTEAVIKRRKTSILKQRATMIALMLAKGAADPLSAKMQKTRELYRGYRLDILRKYGTKALALARQQKK